MTKAEYYLGIAKAVAEKSPCLKKKYGAVLVKSDSILSTGFNGPARKEPHCIACTKCDNGKDVSTYLSCPAVHAEQNVMLEASRKDMLGATLYLYGFDVEEKKEVNAIPCEICFRLLKNSGIEAVISRDGTSCIRLADGTLARTASLYELNTGLRMESK